MVINHSLNWIQSPENNPKEKQVDENILETLRVNLSKKKKKHQGVDFNDNIH